MKRFFVPFLTVALLAACADEADTAAVAEPVEASPAAAPAADTAAVTAATATGTVESVDPAAGRIVIAHGPVDALKWPAMTMGFIATPEQIQAVQPGQQVSFDFDSQGPVNTITRIEPAQ